MTNTKFFCSFFVLIILINSGFMSTEGRPIKDAETQNYIDEEITTKIGELYVEAIKTGGPSDEGRGHKLNSGPSPGEGH